MRIEPIENGNATEISSRAMKPLLVYAQTQFGEKWLVDRLREMRLGDVLSLDYLLDDNNWISFEAGQRIIDHLDESVDDPLFIEKAAKLTMSREVVGLAVTMLRAFSNPKFAYAILFKNLELFNRVGKFSVIKRTRTSLVFRYQSYVPEPNTRFSRYRLHQIASVPLIWGMEVASAKTLEVQDEKKDSFSSYELRWNPRISEPWVVIAAVFCIMLGYIAQRSGAAEIPYIFPFLFFLCGSLICWTWQLRIKEKDNQVRLEEQSNDILYSLKQLQDRYDEMQTLNATLETRVSDRTQELAQANDKLKDLDAAKSRFFANASHELRTPLVSLDTTVQMMLDDGVENDQHAMLLKTGQIALKDMLDNVNDILLRTRSEKNLLTVLWAHLDVGKFVGEYLSVFKPLAGKHGSQLTFDNQLSEGMRVYVDRRHLKKIIANLVGNAIKFSAISSRENGKIDIILKSDGERWLLSVRDNGKGIPQEDLATIFDPFVQAKNNQNREVQGTGLGLSLVKDLVELQSGTVAVESTLGEGSTFSVSLPLGEAHVDFDRLDGSAVSEVRDSRVNLKLKSFEDVDLSVFSEHVPGRPRVLLVEDTPQIAQVLGYVLKDSYNLYFAKDGQEGIERIHELKPDLVISDIMMPRKNGYELAKEMKGTPNLRRIPLVLLTSKADMDSRITGFEHGADEYLSKPFDNREIRTRIKGLLERRAIETEVIHAEKLASVGRLAAGMAHEINNPITCINNATPNVLKLFQQMNDGRIEVSEAKELMEQALENIHESGKRIAELTTSMTGFVHPGAGMFSSYDLNDEIAKTLNILKAGNQKLSIVYDTQFDLSTRVECNATHLNQVWMNLLQNAVDAFGTSTLSQDDMSMPLEVAASARERPDGRQSDRKAVKLKTWNDEQNAYVSVSDNGHGIPAEYLERIFDLYFTTRSLRRGTGMGLYIARKIILDHGGHIDVQSTVGQGTCFTVKLPLQQGEDQRAKTILLSETDDKLSKGVQYPQRS